MTDQAPTQSPPATKALSPIVTLRDLVEKNKSQLALALPKYMDVDRLARVFMTCVQRTPALAECAPISMLGFLFGCAQLGLEPDPVTGEIYPVPFNNSAKGRKEVQMIVGYRGLIKLVTNTDQVNAVYAKEVRANDEFDFDYGTFSPPRHKIRHFTEKERGEITHFYAVAKLKTGESQLEVMTKEDVDKIRARAKASSNGPWVTDYVEMGRKTVTRRLCKYLPKAPSNSRLLLAVGMDERNDLGKPQDLGTLTGDPSEAATPEREEKPTPQMPKELPPPTDPGTAIEP